MGSQLPGQCLTIRCFWEQPNQNRQNMLLGGRQQQYFQNTTDDCKSYHPISYCHIVVQSRNTHLAQRDENGTQCHSLTEAVGWLVDWLFNGTSTQKAQFVPAAGEGHRLSRLRMANGIQCTMPHVTRQQCNTVCSKTLQSHKRKNRQSNRLLTCLLLH